MRRNSKRKLKGSFTIEAALLLPVMLSVIIFIIYISYYLHDKAVLQASAYAAALRGSQMITMEQQKIQENVQMIGMELIQNRLLTTNGISVNVRVSKSEVKVSYEGKFSIPKGIMPFHLLGNTNSPIVITQSVKRIDAVGYIRKMRWGKEILE